MSQSLESFFKDHPFLAIFIAIFMILPMIGAVIHIILKALGKKGIDNSPPSGINYSELDNDKDRDKLDQVR